MFKISIVDTPTERKIVLEGKLVSAWTAEVESAWRSAARDLDGRSLVVDLRNLTLISPEGEDTLLSLMRNGAEFFCGGVLTRHVLKQISRRCRGEEVTQMSISTRPKRRTSSTER
jgi:hypothetical protein